MTPSVPSPPAQIITDLVAGGRARIRADFIAAGVHPQVLARAAAAGEILTQFSRGVYCAPDIPHGMGYAAISLTNPGGVVCLLSAASIHVISDENPGQIWYAVDRAKTHGKPQGSNRDPVRVLHWTGQAMTVGVDVMTFAGVPVNVTSPARTVFDMVRRNLRAGGGEQSNRALRDFMLNGGDLGDVWNIAKAFDHTEQFAPLLRVAEEMRTVMAMPGRM
jgi:predicted transcriptional regulator of viral defense system